jgi:hypothetical protein
MTACAIDACAAAVGTAPARDPSAAAVAAGVLTATVAAGEMKGIGGGEGGTIRPVVNVRV